MHRGFEPSDVIVAAFFLLIVAPAVAFLLAFVAPAPIRRAARFVLLADGLAYAALTVLCLWNSHAPPPQAGFNALILVALLPAFFSWLCFGIWRAARRHEYVQSLPPAQRRVEELHDIDRALASLRGALAKEERRVRSWFIGRAERQQLELDIAMHRAMIAKLEVDRAKHL